MCELHMYYAFAMLCAYNSGTYIVRLCVCCVAHGSANVCHMGQEVHYMAASPIDSIFGAVANVVSSHFSMRPLCCKPR